MKLIRSKLGADRDDGHAAYVEAGNPDYDVLDAPRELLPILLVAKLHEEAEEIREDMTNPEEYADAYQVLFDLAKLNGLAWGEITDIAYMKRIKKGGFEEPRLLIKR